MLAFFCELALNRCAPSSNRGIYVVVGVTLVNVVPGQERSVFNRLGEMPGIRELHHVFGEYDFLVIIEVDGLPLLSKTVDVIRDVEGVKTTHTIVGAELPDT
jgi:DNA-binding Lrp family transcriptional regulator